jgi:nucleoside-diphosphate-sugar epimerase
MARYLVTGAAGFIGARVAELLLDDGHTVLGWDNLNTARLGWDWRLARLQGQTGFDFRPLDICDREALASAWEPGLGAVINLAARAGVRASVRDPWTYARTNLEGTLNLLDLCRERGPLKLVQASTSSLYGAHNPRPFREGTSRPLSPTPPPRSAAELLCHPITICRLDISVLRYSRSAGRPAGRT